MKAKAATPSFCLPTYYRLPSTISVVLNATSSVKQINAQAIPTKPQSIGELVAAEHRLHHMRDGEVVLYKIVRSAYWQARFHLYSGKWIRFSTRKRNLEDAQRLACDRYDEARYRQRMGLTPIVKRFEEIAKDCVDDLRRDLAAGTGKRVYKDYIQVIERYLVPFFGQKYLTSITSKDIAEFEVWRIEQMKRKPKASTLLTFSSAFSRIHQTAIARGWISDKVPLPKFTAKGEKGQARPAFTKDEVVKVRQHLRDWHMGVEGRTGAMRRLLRELVDVLILTGMRQGTESINLCWQHIEWHWDKQVRYIRIWVSGKTGPRWLIAKHECVDALKRLHQQQPDIADMEFDELLAAKSPLKVFRFEDGTQPYEFTHAFRRLLKEMGISKGQAGTTRTLYSLRHTYATMELLSGTDIHTLAKQMGTSVLMLEKHYSKLTATMAAAVLA